MLQPTFGDVPGVSTGATFSDRAALFQAHVHRQMQAGIAGRGAEGAESIVLNEGYEDDQDLGDEIIYTGEGGRDPNNGRQVRDQQLIKGNLALAVSHTQGLPVRVIRGPKLKSVYAPPQGYRYDGLYAVEDHWADQGKAGFLIWRFRLRRSQDQSPIGTAAASSPLGSSVPGRRTSTVQRVVRSSEVSQHVKQLHGYQCQMCGTRLDTPAGPYSEGAHIRPLGRPHNGPDVPENVLCLCPNCHVLFDAGAVSIADDFGLQTLGRQLRTHARHSIDVNHLQYRRKHYGSP